MARRKKAPSLSDELRAAIDKADLSAYELAQAAGVDRSVLSRFLAGKRSITLETADRLAEVLELPSSPGGRLRRRRTLIRPVETAEALETRSTTGATAGRVGFIQMVSLNIPPTT